VMPRLVAVEGVPTPTGPDVDVCKRAGGRFAVLRFSGRLDAKLAKESEAKLRAWMEAKGHVVADSDPTSDNSGSVVESAAYDPPFTPGPLRRNEVLIRLK
jgi:SOUL heme-binding protein